MKVLAINSGSSSIKYQLFDEEQDRPVANGSVLRIGEDKGEFTLQTSNVTSRKEMQVETHHEGLDLVFTALTDQDCGIIKDMSEISAVGHRVTHGGEWFTESTMIDDGVIAKLEQCVSLAPLHNPPNILGIREAQRYLPGVPHVAVFDTSFHHTLPQKAYLYALPRNYYEKYRIRRFGFHGLSYRYIADRVHDLAGEDAKTSRQIVCHLGNGSSVCAIRDGRSVDTSLGFSSFCGLMMGTRPGDIDPGIIFHLHETCGLDLGYIADVLYKKSGLLGISGFSNNMQDIERNARLGDRWCALAMEMFSYSVMKYIGAYASVLNGLDVLVFTAGIGENAPNVRSMICEGLGYLGVDLDEEKNFDVRGVEGFIHSEKSSVNVMVIPTNEERVIIEDTLRIVRHAE